MVVGRFWSLPGGFGRPEDRRLGASGSRKEENPKINQNPQPIWGRSGGFLGHLEVTSVTLGAL
eukprot:3691321-Pyramimonas_sp.AAC.1